MYRFPMVMGHESCGVVESVGDNVTKVKPGDVPKGLMPDGTTRFSCKGVPLYHFMGISSFSEYTVVSQYSVSRIDVAAPLEKICLLGCCIPTGYGAVVNTAQVFKGATVAVFGCGALGISVIQGAVASQASRIFAIDINPKKFEISTEFGATECINPLNYPNQKIEDVIRSKTNGMGVDFSFDTSGGNVEVMNSAFDCVVPGWGKSIIISLADIGKRVSTLPINFIRGKSWMGTSFGGVKGSDLNDYAQKYIEGKLKIDEYIGGNITLEEINYGFESLRKGECIRQVIIL
ncbi:Alcohol dehydrogenase class-3 chain L [Smittium culicis]|uniref:Alcohol dehydrogenase class-3 chain L n=1 Tax=Smittium culicis TaxID=133412 RepID=A0A1R1YN43_9FUNG|nr:Alcohol dehydrogenase class-3 chain L [Smittium culicis]